MRKMKPEELITDPEKFMSIWEPYIPTMNEDELKRVLADTSPHHPNQNMVWLYDRLLMQLANLSEGGES